MRTNNELDLKILLQLPPGGATFESICTSVDSEGVHTWYRHVDGALRRLKRAGFVTSLPRIRGVRPRPLWVRTGKKTTTPGIVTVPNAELIEFLPKFIKASLRDAMVRNQIARGRLQLSDSTIQFDAGERRFHIVVEEVSK